MYLKLSCLIDFAMLFNKDIIKTNHQAPYYSYASLKTQYRPILIEHLKIEYTISTQKKYINNKINIKNSQNQQTKFLYS